MKRCLVTFLFALFLAFPASARCIKGGPCREEQIITRFFSYNGAGLNAGLCGRPYMTWTEGACTLSTNKFRTTRAWTLTRLEGTPAIGTWAATRACDLDLMIGGTGGNGTVVGHLKAGAETTDGFTLYNTTGKITTFTDTEVAAGDMLQIQHTEPGTDYCITEAGCICGTSVAGYQLTLWGIPH